MLKLSPTTIALLNRYKQIAQEDRHYDQSPKLEVSQTVSFFGALYEKMRNSLEYRESHLVRKAAIQRILKRRLLLNQKAGEFTEPLIKELLWGKYLREGSVTQKKVILLTEVVERYLLLRQRIIGQLGNTRQIAEVSDWIVEIISCKIEDLLVPNSRNETFTNFIYQWLRPSIDLTNGSPEDGDVLTYLGVQEAFNKADNATLAYRLIKLYGEESLFNDFWRVYTAVNKYLTNKTRRKITKFIQLQTPPFLILEALLNRINSEQLEQTLINPSMLRAKISNLCQAKYRLTNIRLRRAAIRSIIYIFLTKMLVAISLEIPVDRYLEGQIAPLPLLTNIALPPLLMFIIVLLIAPPGKANTQRILARIQEILTQPYFQTEKRSFSETTRISRPLLTFIFTAVYSLTFLLVFGLIIWILTMLNFNPASQLIFIFFISLVTFFTYRIQQIVRQYRFKEKESALSPITDFLMLPILSVGKWLSEEIGRINILIFLFDFILEAPFKAVFEVVEEWIGFLRAKREEIA